MEESEKSKKGCTYGAGAGLLKKGQGVLALKLCLLVKFFKVYHFYILKLFYPQQNCYTLEEKNIFSATIVF